LGSLNAEEARANFVEWHWQAKRSAKHDLIVASGRW